MVLCPYAPSSAVTGAADEERPTSVRRHLVILDYLRRDLDSPYQILLRGFVLGFHNALPHYHVIPLHYPPNGFSRRSPLCLRSRGLGMSRLTQQPDKRDRANTRQPMRARW